MKCIITHVKASEIINAALRTVTEEDHNSSNKIMANYSDQTLNFLCLLAILLSLTMAHPQYYPVPNNPEKNWRSVILSRNGPSSSTSEPSTTWPSTTLRYFVPEEITGPGHGSVEETRVANRPQDRFKTYPLKAGAPKTSGFAPLALLATILVIAVM